MFLIGKRDSMSCCIFVSVYNDKGGFLLSKVSLSHGDNGEDIWPDFPDMHLSFLCVGGERVGHSDISHSYLIVAEIDVVQFDAEVFTVDGVTVDQAEEGVAVSLWKTRYPVFRLS